MKKLIAMLLALVMVVGLCACTVEKAPETTAPQAEGTTPVETNPAVETTEISLWTYPIGGWGKQETVDALIGAFEAANPGIKVTVE